MDILGYLRRAVEDGAADLFIVAGSQVSEKVEKQMRNIGEDRLMPKDSEALIADLYHQAGRSMDYCKNNKKDNFSLSVPGLARFRVSVFRQRGSLAAVARVIQFGIPDAEKMEIPEQALMLADEVRGLVLVTGLAGSGKSVTEACMIDRINRSRDAHIMTIENPIEFLHRNVRCIVSQQEVAIDVDDTVTAIYDSLQQAPDVLFLSELNGCEAMEAAITAAETGRLVIATVYSQNVVSAVEFFIHAFPSDRHEGIRMRLSNVLQGVICQQLLPGLSGILFPAFEVMRVNRVIRSQIRENNLEEIFKEIQAGVRGGMLPMDQSILNEFNRKRITKETALEYAVNREDMRRKLWVIAE